ncbi:MAG: DNA topoisomerase VI subunit B [Candidatus Thorarchaeota archaeon]
MSRTSSLDTNFTSISPAEFFYRNRQMAGFGNPTQAVYSTVRELVENSLDACEDAGRPPIIDVRIENTSPNLIRITVSDNGTGVPHDHVPNAFGSVLYGSKYASRQRRGTFGLGVTMAILYGQITTDMPVTILTQSDDELGKEYRLFIDVERNTPIIDNQQLLSRPRPGTTVTIHLKGDLKRSRERVEEYLQLTTISSPHARITFAIDNYPASNLGSWYDHLPPQTQVSKPHPRAVDIELLRRLILQNGRKELRNFLVDSFQQVGNRTASRFLKFHSLSPQVQVESLSRDDLSRISTALRQYDGFGKPDSKSLSPIGKTAFLKSASSVFGVSTVHYESRGTAEWNGHPFIVEGVIATCDTFPKSDAPALYRFANRVPLLYDGNDDVMTRALRKIGWSRYGVNSTIPTALFIHLCSTKIPYKEAGKQSISAFPTIESELVALYRALGRSLGRLMKKAVSSTRNLRKMREYDKAFKLVARFSSELAEEETPPQTDQHVKMLFEVISDD